MDWSGGYVVDTLCSPGFYREMAPGYLGYVALLAGYGVVPPRTAVELGCGMGFNAAVLAAANPACRWTAVDFNPDHIAAANAFAAAAGLENLVCSDAGFADWAGQGNGPFDLALLHGVYSWIDEATARDVRTILRQGLSVGGVAYLSYNCQPGWAAVGPLRRLFIEHARRHPGTAAERVRAGIAFARTLADRGAGYFAATPAAVARLEELAEQDPRYLAHEYLNADWRLLYHGDVAADMATAKLGYLSLADPTDAFADLSVPEACRDLWAAGPDRGMAETIRDFALNRAFRRDLYGRGAVRLTAAEREERLLGTPLAALTFPDDLALTVRTAVGPVTADPAIARPLVRRLWEAGPSPLATVAEAGVALPDLLRTVALLVLGGQIHPAVAVTAAGRAAARRFNTAVCDKTLRGEALEFFAAPGIGSGVPAGVLEQAVYRVLCEAPEAGVAQVAAAVLPVLDRLGRPLRRDGQPIADADERRRELEARLARHRQRRVPLWRALGVL